jgi:hypothetical protein
MNRSHRPRSRRMLCCCLILMFSLIGFGGVGSRYAQAEQSGSNIPEESTFFATVFVEPGSTYNTESEGDLWPSAWSDDDYVYTANGDGHGFMPRSQWGPIADRPDVLVNRISGHPSQRNVAGIALAGEDKVGQVWTDPERYNRKPTGMISVDGVLYLAVQDLRSEASPAIFNDAPAATILKSIDKGRTWTWDRRRPMFDNYMFTTIMFLDYGQDSVNNTFDNYVYAYGLDYNWRDSFSDTVPDPTKLYLARVPKNRVQHRSIWEFYAGQHRNTGDPRWVKQIERKQPVLHDERRLYSETLFPIFPDNLSVLSQGSIVYNKPLERYIYTSWTEFTFEFYEAPTPWGPWRRFLSRDFGIYPWFPSTHGGYTTVIPSKFISDDGKEMWLNSNTFAGGVENYNMSFRRLLVTPWAPSKPSNPPNNKNLALPAYGQDVTPISRANFHFGNVHFMNNGIRTESEDSWNGEAKTEDYWGYTWSRAYRMNKVVYTTGTMFGTDGGWFNDVRVQVRQNFEWVDVANLRSIPVYPNDQSAGTNQTYTFMFQETWGDGVRIIGTPGGTATFTSFAELEVYFSRVPGVVPGLN